VLCAYLISDLSPTQAPSASLTIERVIQRGDIEVGVSIHARRMPDMERVGEP
jgi:hypothetical protein